jgi:hypothetical protein
MSDVWKCNSTDAIYNLMKVCTNQTIQPPSACFPDFSGNLRIFAKIWGIIVSIVGASGNLLNLCAVSFAASQKR